jgi:hypothetical protein
VRWFRRQPDPLADGRSPEPAAADELGALLTALIDLDRYILRNSEGLPTAAVARARWIVDTLRDVLDLSAGRPLDISAGLTVRGIAADYLPTTLRSYVALNHEAHGVSPGANPQELLLEQLDTLQEAAVGTLRAMRAQDVDAMKTQGSFLRSKFSRSDLDL